MWKAQDLQLFSDSLQVWDIHTWRHHHPRPSGSYCERHELNLAAFNHHVLVYWLNIKIIGPYFQNKSIHFSPFHIFIALVFYLWTQRLSFCYIWCLSLDICIQWVHTILMDLYVSDSQQIVQKSRFWALIIPAVLLLAQLFLQPLKAEMCALEKGEKNHDNESIFCTASSCKSTLLTRTNTRC